MRHPILLFNFYRREPELAKIHTEIELRKAESVYSRFAEIWDPVSVIRAFRERISCYPNSYLYVFCRHFQPEIVIETGVYYGASSAFILKALEANGKGHLYSIDLPDVTYKRDDLKVHQDLLSTKGTTWYRGSAGTEKELDAHYWRFEN